jgi:hypothetical protein
LLYDKSNESNLCQFFILSDFSGFHCQTDPCFLSDTRRKCAYLTRIPTAGNKEPQQ